MEENSFWGKDIKNYQSNAHFEHFKNNKKKFFIFAKKGLVFKIEKMMITQWSKMWCQINWHVPSSFIST